MSAIETYARLSNRALNVTIATLLDEVEAAVAERRRRKLPSARRAPERPARGHLRLAYSAYGRDR